MKRLLQISNYFYPNRGGIEQVARDIARALQGTCEQKIICFNETAEDNNIQTRRKETVIDNIDGVEVIRCGCMTKQASQSISLTFGKQLKKVLNDFHPDTVIFHYPNPYQAYFLLKELKHRKQNKDKNSNRNSNHSPRLILYWHLDITKQKILGKLFRGQTLKLIDQADTILGATPTHIDRSIYLAKHKEKCRILPYCIDPDRLRVTEAIRRKAEEIRQSNQDLSQKQDAILCFAIGRHIPYKGFTYLIQASRYLDDRFRIVIAGSGPLTEQLKQEAKEDRKISFPGKISDDDLIAYYLAMDIFCFPSITKNECFGLALAEAMTFEKPAVTFTIPGSGVNYVNKKDETGLEVTNSDPKAYAEAITRLADNPELRTQLGKNGKTRVETLFSPEAFRTNLMNLLNKPDPKTPTKREGPTH